MNSTPNGSGKYCCTGSTSSDSNEMKFAPRFVRALRKILRRSRSSSSSSSIGMKKRSERVKMAAYWCMARAVGSRRGWSRAILCKLGRRRRRHHQYVCSSKMILMRRRKRKRKKKIIIKTTLISSSRTGDSNSHGDGDEEEDDMAREARKLRKVVPGGKCMDICSLLEETADFVRCLRTQVSIMQTIAHHFSNSAHDQ